MFKKTYSLLMAAMLVYLSPVSRGSETNILYEWNFGQSGSNLSNIKSQNVEFTKGKVKTGARFNGKNSVIKVKPDINLNNLQGSFTITVWFKVSGDSPENKVTMALVCKNSSGSGYSEPFNFCVWTADADGTKKAPTKSLWARVGDGKACLEMRSGGNVNDGKFHHAALIFSKEANSAYIYLDGVEVAKKLLPADWKPYKNNDDLTIGVWPVYGNYFNGIIDDVMIYNTALSPEEVMGNYISGIIKSDNNSKSSTFTAAASLKIPIVDGVFSENEWCDAVKIDGFINKQQILSNRKASLYLTHDKKRLYIAAITDIWNGKLKSEAQDNDDSVLLDDTIEFAAQGKDNSSYRILVNSKGKYLETINNKPATDRTITDFASKISGNKWFFEMSVPCEYLNLNSLNDGQTLKFNIARNYMKPPMDAFDVSIKEKFTDTFSGTLDRIDTYTNVLLKDKSAVTALRLGDNFDIGEVISEFAIKNNPRDNHINSKIDIVKAGEVVEEKDEKNSTDNLEIKTNKILEISNKPVIAVLKIQALNQDNSVLFYRNVPFLINNNIFDLDYIVDRTKHKLILDINKYVPGAFTADKNILVEFYNKAGKQEFKELIIDYDRNARFSQINVPLGSLPDMVELKIKVSLVAKDNKCISSKECSFIKMENSEGVKCKIGEDNTVPPPWTPLKYNDYFKVDCWNREYDFQNETFLKQINNAGIDILNAPLNFNIKQDGETVKFKNIVQQYTEKSADKGIVIVESGSGNLKLTSRITVEFDGMIRVDGSLSSIKPEKIDSMALEIPIKSEIAKYLYASRGEDLGVGYCGDWEARIGKLGDYWKSKFTPFVWLGDEDKGLVWFAENNKDWRTAKEDSEIEIVRKGEQTLLRINYADKPFELSKPFEFTFGIQATPVKPRPVDWRKMRYGSFNDNKEASSIVIGWAGRRPNSNIYWGLKYDYAKLRGELNAARNLGFKSIVPYSFPQIGDGDSPEIRYYLEEWAREKSDGHPRKYPMDWKSENKEFPFTYLSYASKSYQNYWIYNFYNLLKNIPELKGIYYDGAIVASSNNPKQSCLYIKDGKERSTYPIFAARDFYKRVYKMVKSINKDNTITGHISCTRGIPCEAFFDILVDGEHLAGYLARKNYDYVDTIPLDVWRTQFTCRQIGGIPVFLPQIDRAFFQNAKKVQDMKDVYAKSTRTLISMLLVHDISAWKYLADSKEITDYFKRLDEFGIVDSTFYPYWNNQDLVTGFHDDIKISVYKNRNKILLGIANISNKNAEGDIKINLSKLGLPENIKAKSLVSDKNIIIQNDCLKSVKVNNKDYEMIEISPN